MAASSSETEPPTAAETARAEASRTAQAIEQETLEATEGQGSETDGLAYVVQYSTGARWKSMGTFATPSEASTTVTNARTALIDQGRRVPPIRVMLRFLSPKYGTIQERKVAEWAASDLEDAAGRRIGGDELAEALGTRRDRGAKAAPRRSMAHFAATVFLRLTIILIVAVAMLLTIPWWIDLFSPPPPPIIE
jgi:hypothetical protein